LFTRSYARRLKLCTNLKHINKKLHDISCPLLQFLSLNLIKM